MRRPNSIYFLNLRRAETQPPGYFDISAPFDFLAAYATLEQVIAVGKYSAEQLHA